MLFYDIEIFPHYWCVVILDDHGDKDATDADRYVFEDVPTLREFYKNNRKETWVGFNSRSYDAPMLRFIMLELDPFECSQALIVRGWKWWNFPYDVKQLYKRIPLRNFDCMPNPPKGLKKLEGFRGSSIVETSVPFDTPVPLTEQQKKEVIFYCTHDVKETRKIFYDSIKEYQAHEGLIKTFSLDPSNFEKTKAQLAAIILEAKPQPHYDEWEFEIPDTIRIEKYKHIMDWYKDPSNFNYKKKLDIEVAGVPHTFAWGGLHGARKKYSRKGHFLNMDVGSYYPALMIEYNFLSRNVMHPEKYKEIRDYRLVLKANKDPRQEPYKIVLNGTYGAMKDKYNALYDPRQANSVCVAGQLMLLDLIEHLEDHCELVQSNTDGILVRLYKPEDEEQIIAISQEWSKRVRMELEYDKFSEVWQKDVNNYLVIPEGDLYDEKGKERFKRKGAWLKKLSTLDYDLPILNEALLNYMLHGKEIEETINEARDIIKFQKVCMVSAKYICGVHGFYDKKTKTFIGKSKQVNEKYLRVFASNNPEDGGVFKIHATTGGVAKFSDTATNCFICNHDILTENMANFPELDKEWYINEARKRLKAFS